MKAKEPLETFLTTFNQYKADLDINPEEYVKNLDETSTENGNAVPVLREDILKHQRIRKEFKSRRFSYSKWRWRI